MTIQFDFNFCLRADCNIQWLGEALVKVDQYLQPWKREFAGVLSPY